MQQRQQQQQQQKQKQQVCYYSALRSNDDDDSSILRLFRHMNNDSLGIGCCQTESAATSKHYYPTADHDSVWTERLRYLIEPEQPGYCIVSTMLTKDECDNAIDSIWMFLNYSTYGRIQRREGGLTTTATTGTTGTTTDTCTNTYTTVVIGNKSYGNDDVHQKCIELYDDHLFISNGAGYILSHVHELLADRLYTNLFGTCELHSSKEGFYFNPSSTTTDDDNPNTAPTLYCQQRHSFDEASDATTSCTNLPFIRSMVAFEDAVLTLQWYDSNPSLCIPIPVSIKKGDVFLWRTDGNISSIRLSTKSTTKMIAILFLNMQPATCTPEYLLAMKMEAYNQRQTSTYRLDVEEWIRPPQHDNSKLRTRQYFDTSPPLVSMKQAQLYGLVPYQLNDKSGDDMNDGYDRRQQRAIIRGVRFKDVDVISLQQITVPPLSSSSGEVAAHLIHLTTSDPDDMIGQDKYLGGMASPCQQYVYGVPGGAKRVLRIRISDGHMDCIGPSFEGKFKWLRGVTVSASVMKNHPTYPNGCCLALPCNSASVLKINPTSNEVYTFGKEILKECGSDRWHYHGGNVAALNGWLYAIPANANRVVKINPITDEIVYIGPTFHSGGQKWFGGITGTDGCIYGIPHNETSVLKIDPADDTVTLMVLDNNQPLPVGQWKWHGGLRSGNKIYGFPNNADAILVINCSEGRVYTIDSVPLTSGRHRIPQDNRYKYLGGATTLDHHYAYLFPCDAERVLRIDCRTDELCYIGPHLLDGENKFQNGFVGRDGCVYGIPQRASGVLRITPPHHHLLENSNDTVEVMDCGPELIGVKDKFEGGVLGPDGCIYCIPLRSKVCVKIVPGIPI